MADSTTSRVPGEGGVPTGAPLWTIALVLAVAYSGLIVLGLAALAVGGVDRLSSLLAMAGLATSWIAAMALGAGLLSGGSLRAGLGLVAPRIHGIDWGVAVVGGLAASQAGDLVLRLSGSGRGAALEHMLALLAEARGVQLALALLILGAGAGVAEELLFRGFVQGRLVGRLGPIVGVGIAAVAFAVAHFDPRHATFALLFGVYVGAIALWSGSIGPAIMIHAVNNMIAVGLAARGLDDAGGAAKPGALAAQLVVALLLAVACAGWVRRRARPAALDDFAGPRVGSAP
jgi:membrane protease YdiL (CAAX protease family)